MMLMNGLYGAIFKWIHGNKLVYNTCWEDPRIDRQALQFGEDDTVLVITSAGCNTLDYALTSPRHVYAVDMNPRQNAVLEMKMAGIRKLEFEDFFAMFGQGRIERIEWLYRDTLRPALSPRSQVFWDNHLHYFDAERPNNSYYFHGTCGWIARMIHLYLTKHPRLRHGVEALLNASTVEEQRQVYADIRHIFWSRPVKWAVSRDTTLALAGVPKAQRKQVESTYAGGITQFLMDVGDAVFGWLPLGDNYFWRVYITGRYTPDCCPEYLKPEKFHALKDGLVDRISVHTDTIEGFLHKNDDVEISRYVLLDHMDWLNTYQHDMLEREWQEIVRHARHGTRMIWRSGGLRVDYVDPIQVTLRGRKTEVGELLTYDQALAERLHPQDRVHTYGSFYIADLAVG